jgi:hypothetical protein
MKKFTPALLPCAVREKNLGHTALKLALKQSISGHTVIV